MKWGEEEKGDSEGRRDEVRCERGMKKRKVGGRGGENRDGRGGEKRREG